MGTRSTCFESLEHRTLLSTVQAVGSTFTLGGTPWSPDLNVAGATYYGRQDVTDADGNMLSKWVDPTTKTVFLQSFYSNGTPRTAPLDTGVSDTNLMENIAISGDGKTAAMVWMGKTTQKTYRSYYVDSGQMFSITPITPDPLTGIDAKLTAKASTFAIAPKTTVTIYYPFVAMDYAGNFVVAWERNATDAIHAQQYTSSGALLGREIGGIATLSGQHNTMAIAMNQTPGIMGNFAMIWGTAGHDNPDGSMGVYGQVFRNGSLVSNSEIALNQNTLGNQNISTVAMARDGGFVAAWAGPDADGQGAWIRRFDSSARPLTDDTLVNDDPTGSQGRVRVAIGASGDSLVAFETGDYSGNGHADVYAQAFAADGSRIGSNFFVGTNDGLYLDVAAQPNDQFAIIWGDHNLGVTSGQKYEILS